jgi:hypothetical protein
MLTVSVPVAEETVATLDASETSASTLAWTW